jgi:hypothetical protein
VDRAAGNVRRCRFDPGAIDPHTSSPVSRRYGEASAAADPSQIV